MAVEWPVEWLGATVGSVRNFTTAVVVVYVAVVVLVLCLMLLADVVYGVEKVTWLRLHSTLMIKP